MKHIITASLYQKRESSSDQVSYSLKALEAQASHHGAVECLGAYICVPVCSVDV